MYLLLTFHAVYLRQLCNHEIDRFNFFFPLTVIVQCFSTGLWCVEKNLILLSLNMVYIHFYIWADLSRDHHGSNA